MRIPRSAYRLFAYLVVFSLAFGSVAPVAQAQDAVPTYLPLVSSEAGATLEHLLFRTRVTVATPAAWRDLGRMGVVLLDSGEGWALVLADDAQVADLARWGYAPDGTDSVAALAAAHARAAGASVADLSHLLAAEAAAAPELRGAVAAADAARAGLHAAPSSAAPQPVAPSSVRLPFAIPAHPFCDDNKIVL